MPGSRAEDPLKIITDPDPNLSAPITKKANCFFEEKKKRDPDPINTTKDNLSLVKSEEIKREKDLEKI